MLKHGDGRLGLGGREEWRVGGSAELGDRNGLRSCRER